MGYEGPKCNLCSEGYERQEESGKCLIVFQCSNGWKEILGKCHKVGTGLATLDKSIQKCKEMGGHIFQPLNISEEEAILAFNKEHGQNKLWIGLTDQAEESKYVFSL